jgi:hypothetical protein
VSEKKTFDPGRDFKCSKEFDATPIELTDDDVQDLIDHFTDVQKINPMAAKLLLFAAGCRADSAAAMRLMRERAI